MKKAGMILGLIGGIIGIVFAVMTIGAGALFDMGIREVLESMPGNGEVPGEIPEIVEGVGRMFLGGGIGGLIFSIVGLIGAIMTNKTQKLAGILMLIGGIVGFVFMLVGFAIPGILLIIGGILAMVAKEQEK